MKGSTHLAIGILSAFEISILTSKPFCASCVICAGICSLLPDIDEPNSTICKKILKTSFSKKIYTIFIYLISLITLIVLGYINKNLILNLFISFIVVIILEKNLKHSTLRKLFLTSLSFILSLSLYSIKVNNVFILISIFIGITPWLKHRGFTHSLCACAALYFTLNELEKIIHINYISFYGVIGYLSHILLCDLFTKGGVPIFYPIWDKKISLCSLKVGSSKCNMVESIYIFVCIALVIYTFKVKFSF